MNVLTLWQQCGTFRETLQKAGEQCHYLMFFISSSWIFSYDCIFVEMTHLCELTLSITILSLIHKKLQSAAYTNVPSRIPISLQVTYLRLKLSVEWRQHSKNSHKQNFSRHFQEVLFKCGVNFVTALQNFIQPKDQIQKGDFSSTSIFSNRFLSLNSFNLISFDSIQIAHVSDTRKTFPSWLFVLLQK